MGSGEDSFSGKAGQKAEGKGVVCCVNSGDLTQMYARSEIVSETPQGWRLIATESILGGSRRMNSVLSSVNQVHSVRSECSRQRNELRLASQCCNIVTRRKVAEGHSEIHGKPRALQ